MNILVVVVVGALAFALYKLSRKTDAVSGDQRIVGGARNPMIYGDLIGSEGVLTPPSSTDKAPVGPPRVDASEINYASNILPVPVTFTPISPPTNSVQITPAFKLPSFFTGVTSKPATAPTPPPPSSVLASSLPLFKPSGIQPPKTAPMNVLAVPKSTGFLLPPPAPTAVKKPSIASSIFKSATTARGRL